MKLSNESNRLLRTSFLAVSFTTHNIFILLTCPIFAFNTIQINCIKILTFFGFCLHWQIYWGWTLEFEIVLWTKMWIKYWILRYSFYFIYMFLIFLIFNLYWYFIFLWNSIKIWLIIIEKFIFQYFSLIDVNISYDFYKIWRRK